MRPFKNRIFQRRLVGERLRTAMSSRNYTCRKLAYNIGVTEATVSNIVNEKSDPCVDTLYCIATELDVSTDWLLGLTDFPYRVFINL